MAESPYRWLYRLGSGSAGAVWAAERDGRTVAVKVLHNANQPAMAETLRREMRIGPLIAQHPNVVAVRKVEVVGGVVHLEMDLVEGPSLAQVLEGRLVARKGPIPASIAVAWTIEVLDALAFVGRAVAPTAPQSFCHRDIKPANLLLDPSGLVRVTDFGVARATAELGFQTTATGVVKGSPRFMAPEVITERAPDARADQFSTGAVLFELVTGAPLYEGRDLPEVILLAVNADVERRLARWTGPPEVVPVLRRMLAKSRDERFPTPDAAASALRAIRVAGPHVREHLAEYLAYRIDAEELLPDSDQGQSTRELPLDDPDATTSGGRPGGSSTVDLPRRGNALPTFLPSDEVGTHTTSVSQVPVHDVTSDLQDVTPALDELPGPPLADPGSQSEPTAEPTPHREDHLTATPDALRVGPRDDGPPTVTRPVGPPPRGLAIPKPRPASADEVPTKVLSAQEVAAQMAELPTQVLKASKVQDELRRRASEVSTVETPAAKVAKKPAPRKAERLSDTWVLALAAGLFLVGIGGATVIVLLGLLFSLR